ncbi:MAG: sulfatase-like hydrolase/transferase [Rhodobacterales bacterium]|nr:sulfatase-like hydrolase/transferase [Rhodobacterales bacterium]
MSPDGPKTKPNIVLIFSDDQGYADVGCYWQPRPDGAFPKIETPHLDRMAVDGVRFNNFYVAAPVCTPSRAALMTGCYPPRVGFGHKEFGPGVLTPTSKAGLHPDEVTLAEVMKSAGYATGCVGKWHLGHQPKFLPTNQGFDGFYGIPYSNNQRPLPLMRDEKVIRQLPETPVLTGMLTQAALSFIDTNAHQPFFLYLAHSAPHWPWNVVDPHRIKGLRGLYGDEVARIDWSTGEILASLERNGLTDNTLVLFCSDNGPWIDARTGLGGSAYPLRGLKAETFEGGVRTPMIAKFPGVIPPGLVSEQMGSVIDFLPTLAGLVGAELPDVPIDGKDIWPMFTTAVAQSPHEVLFYYARGRLEAVRDRRYKLMFGNMVRTPGYPEALYDLQEDPAETTDVRDAHPQVVTKLRAAAQRMRGELGDAMNGVDGPANRPVGVVQ